METSKKDSNKLLFQELNKIIADLEKDMNIPTGFFDSLKSERSDWAFIIKLHALFEAAITHLLVHYLGKEQLESIFANLQMSDPKIGKIAFINKLGLLEKEDVSFIRTLSEIRNQYTHMIRNLNLPLPDIITKLSKDRLQCIERLYYSGDDPEKLKVKTNPRLYIFAAAMTILPKIYVQKEDATTKRDAEERQRQIGEDFEREYDLSD